MRQRLVTANQEESQALTSQLDEIDRNGARKMLLEALEHEVAEYTERHKQERDESGRALVVRNGKSKGRKVTVKDDDNALTLSTFHGVEN